MKLIRILLAAAIVFTVGARRLAAAGSSVDILQPLPPPPELIIRHAAEIGLSATQRRALEREFAELSDAARPAVERLTRESRALAELVAKDKPDEAAVLAQFDRLSDAERDVKRARIQMSLRAGAHLTSEQRAKLQNLRPAGEGGALNGSAAFAAKVQRVHHAIQRAKAEGRDLTKIRELWARFESARAERNPAETLRVLDEALALLEGASVQQNP